MSPPLTREADLRDQRLQRLGGQAVGWGLVGVGLAGLLAWFGLGEGQLAAVALVPPAGLCFAGGAVVVWSRGIDVLEDPELPAFDELPASDPRKRLSLQERRARWIWSATVWAAGCVLSALAVWLTRGLVPGIVRGALFLAGTLGPTLVGARWLERTNGESSWPRQ